MKTKIIITVCAHCEKIKLTDEIWEEGKIEPDFPKNQISPVICPDCAEKFYDYKKKRP
jgi:hypothetical protein